ncbi:glycosyltransferase [Planctomycetota bacterium]
MNFLIKNKHHDNAGGGRHAFQVAELASSFYEVAFDDAYVDYALTGYNKVVFQPPFDTRPDVFMAVDHHCQTPPEGTINIHFCFFPGYGQCHSDYDLVIANSDYTKSYVERLWHKPCWVVNPYVYESQYAIGRKENLILCVGSYFLEADGHSKNQHLILEWFVKQALYKKYKLVMAGFAVNPSFFAELKRVAEKCPHVEVLESVPHNQLKALYSRARYLISATGFERTNPYQTEHFGYIAVEAMVSGCQPLVHNSGGCRDIQGVRVWDRFEELEPLMVPTNPHALRKHGLEYTRGRSLKQFKEVVSAIRSLTHV